jgi:hypothetical protein
MKSRRSTAAAAAGFVVVAILGAIALGTQTLGSGGGASPAIRAPNMPGVCGGKQLSLAEASARAPYDVLVPDHKLASTENLTTAEWCDASQLLVLTFSSGVSVEMMPSELGDPASEFAGQEASYPGVGDGRIDQGRARSLRRAGRDRSFVRRTGSGWSRVRRKQAPHRCCRKWFDRIGRLEGDHGEPFSLRGHIPLRYGLRRFRGSRRSPCRSCGRGGRR